MLKAIISLCIWIGLFGFILFLNASGIHYSRETQIWISILGLIHSAVGFWTHGGQRISAPGVALFGTGLFAYFPALTTALNPAGPHGGADLEQAVAIVFVAQAVMYAVFWCPEDRHLSGRYQGPSGTRSRMVLAVGVLLLGGGAAASRIGLFGDLPLADGAAYSGVVLLGVWALRSRAKAVFAYVVVGTAFLTYLEFVFSGFGRLRIGSMGLALAILLAYRWRGRLTKAVLLAATAPAISYMAGSRAEFNASITGERTETGLESVISPMVRFGQLLEMDAAGQFAHSWGTSFLTALVALVPRAIWPDKPIGFGAELGLLFRPELAAYGHSELALLHGEFLHAFGAFGLILFVAALGIFVRLVDRVLVLSMSKETSTLMASLLVSMGVIVAASIVDLIWGGAFTYVARAGPRILILGSLFIAVWTIRAAAASSRGEKWRVTAEQVVNDSSVARNR